MAGERGRPAGWDGKGQDEVESGCGPLRPAPVKRVDDRQYWDLVRPAAPGEVREGEPAAVLDDEGDSAPRPRRPDQWAAKARERLYQWRLDGWKADPKGYGPPRG